MSNSVLQSFNTSQSWLLTFRVEKRQMIEDYKEYDN